MKNVLLIDSGSGGVNVLKECVKICPHGNFVMFCDNLNMPYGSKTKEELLKITIKNLNSIRTLFKFDIVVFACNTLTSVCIDDCRAKFPDVEFVGTVPAIKPALQLYQEKDICVLATKATIENNKLIANHPDVKCVEMRDLAGLIDESLDNLILLKPYLKEKLSNIKVNALVLGCTHYVAVREIIQQVLPETEIFDGATGVARRLASLIGESDGFSVQIVTSLRNDMWAKLWDFYNKTNQDL